MPIVNQPSAPATKAGAVAEADEPEPGNPGMLCTNCQTPITPCACHPFCNAPFMGYIHQESHSHLCGWPTLLDGTPGTDPKVGTPDATTDSD